MDIHEELGTRPFSNEHEEAKRTTVEVITSYVQALQKLRSDRFPNRISIMTIKGIFPYGGNGESGIVRDLNDRILSDPDQLTLEMDKINRKQGLYFNFFRQGENKTPLTQEEATRTMEFLDQIQESEICRILLAWSGDEEWQYADQLGVSSDRLNTGYSSLPRGSYRVALQGHVNGLDTQPLTPEQKLECLTGFRHALTSPSTDLARIRLLPLDF